eukprot:gene3115-21194_t
MILGAYRPLASSILCAMILVITVGCAVHFGGSPADFGKLYFRPWNRAAPYLFGMLGAFALKNPHAKNIKALMSSALLRAVLYVVATGMLFGTLVWQWKYYATIPLMASAGTAAS